MKKQSKILLLILVIIFLATPTFAEAIQIMIENQYLNLDVSPIIENGSTLVPVRAIFENLGAIVEWNNETKTVVGKYNNTIIQLIINDDIALINGKKIKLDVPAKIINGSTLVPARFVAESLGTKVDWDGSSRTVLINSEKPIIANETKDIQTKEPARATEGIYVGSINSDKYHKSTCRWAKTIKSYNETWFKDRAHAEKQGYTPCGTCKP